MSDIIIDTHTHYVHKRFDCGRKEIVEGLADENIVAVIEAAIDYESNEKMVKLCEKYPFVYMAVGCHPNCVGEMDEQKFSVLEKLLSNDKVVAIGETGLDYAHEISLEQRELQKYWFRRYIALSLNSRKPLVIHCREAYEDLINILREYRLNAVPGVVHCFSGNKEQAAALIELGFYLGIGGMFTRLPCNSETVCAIKELPLERMVLETDAPFLVPNGAPGSRNTSHNLNFIVEELAVLKNCERRDVLETILKNTRRLYPQVV